MIKRQRKQGVCIVCGNNFYKYRKVLKFCTRQCASQLRKTKVNEEYKQKMRQRISEKSEIDEKTQCWNWKKYKNKDGRGYCHFNNKTIMASRASYLSFIGEISENLEVCHKCDNPSCVNPEHLFIGTHKDNIEDRDLKGRGARGEKLGKLKEQDILEIRNFREKGFSQQKIADIFKVRQTTISRILLGKTWNHI